MRSPTPVQAAACGSVIAASVLQSPVAGGSTVLLVPGDISGPREEMAHDAGLGCFSRWSLEALAVRLAAHLPGDTVIVLHPPRRERGFSCWDGFVPGLDRRTGDPVGGYDGGGTCCARLWAVLEASERQCAGLTTGAPVQLLGFSKGCILLNQVLAEFGRASRAGKVGVPAVRLLRRTASVTWLDPGVSAQGPVFLDKHRLLKHAAGALAGSHPPPRLAVALSSYTAAGGGGAWRNWVPRWMQAQGGTVVALRRFQKQMGRHGVVVEAEILPPRPPTLDTHFELLEAFSPVWKSAQQGRPAGMAETLERHEGG
jgi:hypothetical protein